MQRKPTPYRGQELKELLVILLDQRGPEWEPDADVKTGLPAEMFTVEDLERAFYSIIDAKHLPALEWLLHPDVCVCSMRTPRFAWRTAQQHEPGF